VPVGVVSGLQREIQCLGPLGDTLSFAGVGPERAEAGARQLIAEGATALLSFGVAGGMAPIASAGALVLATSVIDAGQVYQTDQAWHRSLQVLLQPMSTIIEGAVLGTDKMLGSSQEKQQLHGDSGALVCDMESHAVARVAVAAGLPFMVMRAVSDPHTRNVPKWVLRCLTPDGGVETAKLLRALARRPWALPALIGLAGDSKKAFAALSRVAGLAGPGLGLPL
jgi:adenosylhomocysteine nucleosidase